MANSRMCKWFKIQSDKLITLWVPIVTEQKREWLWVKNKFMITESNSQIQLARKKGEKFREIPLNRKTLMYVS